MTAVLRPIVMHAAVSMVGAIAISSACWAASPITPERPLPQLSEAAKTLTTRVQQWHDGRAEMLSELAQLREELEVELQQHLTQAPPAISATLPVVQQLAQIEIWRAELTGDVGTAVIPSSTGTPGFTGRDNLYWYAVLMEAAGDLQHAEAVATRAKVATESIKLVAALVQAPSSGHAATIGDLQQRLKQSPKDPVTAAAVEIILRRHLTTASDHAELLSSAMELKDRTTGSLRAYLDATSREQRRTELESMIGTDRLRMHGTLVDGSAFDTQSLAGSVALIAFWAPQVSACNDELRRLVALDREYAQGDLQIVSVNTVRGEGALAAYLEQHPEMTWLQVVDTQAAAKGLLHPLVEELGVAKFPVYVVIDRAGKLQSIDAGDELESLIESLMAPGKRDSSPSANVQK